MINRKGDGASETDERWGIWGNYTKIFLFSDWVEMWAMQSRYFYSSSVNERDFLLSRPCCQLRYFEIAEFSQSALISVPPFKNEFTIVAGKKELPLKGFVWVCLLERCGGIISREDDCWVCKKCSTTYGMSLSNTPSATAILDSSNPRGYLIIS